jgi:NADH dehydrogenase FAD-containing subunit
MLRVILVHPGDLVLPELGEELGRYASRKLAERGDALRPFRFKILGLLASIGRRTGVARILGINFSGFVAWWLWRTIYLLKLPRLEKKLRVALDLGAGPLLLKGFRTVSPWALADDRRYFDGTRLWRGKRSVPPSFFES